MTKIINLFAGPGAGKSTAASALFSLMKAHGEHVELVTEYAKDLVWDKARMDNQLAILGKQDKRLHRLVGNVDYVITDSPLLLGAIYIEKGSRFDNADFRNTVRWAFNSYDNINFFLRRLPNYDPRGRNQGSIAEAVALDDSILDFMKTWRVGWHGVDVGPDTAEEIYATVSRHSQWEKMAHFYGESRNGTE